MAKQKVDEIERLIQFSEKTLVELAYFLETKPERISEYRNGRHEITVNKLKIWCKKLGINIQDLFD